MSPLRAAAGTLLAVLVPVLLSCAEERTPPPEATLHERSLEIDGETYSVAEGSAWRFDRGSKRWVFVQAMYDPRWFEKNYIVEGDRVFRVDPATGNRWEAKRLFASGFEEADRLADLVGPKTRWTSVTLQSPSAKTVKDYVRLRQRILKGESGFLDNRVEPSAEVVHSGERALRTYSVAPAAGMVCAKSSLETELLHFRKGDDFWFSGWFYAVDRLPLTIMDLETTWIEEHPGMRIMVGGNGLMFELKWGAKPKWGPEKRREVPVRKWFHVVAHLKLSDRDDGVVELWQDGVKTVMGRGRTLPLPECVYNSLEVGISATQVESTLYVDDVEVSDAPLRQIRAQ